MNSKFNFSQIKYKIFNKFFIIIHNIDKKIKSIENSRRIEGFNKENGFMK